MFPRRLTVPHYTFSDTNDSHLLSETKLRTYGGDPDPQDDTPARGNALHIFLLHQLPLLETHKPLEKNVFSYVDLIVTRSIS